MHSAIKPLNACVNLNWISTILPSVSKTVTIKIIKANAAARKDRVFLTLKSVYQRTSVNILKLKCICRFVNLRNSSSCFIPKKRRSKYTIQ